MAGLKDDPYMSAPCTYEQSKTLMEQVARIARCRRSLSCVQSFNDAPFRILFRCLKGSLDEYHGQLLTPFYEWEVLTVTPEGKHSS